MKIKQQIRRSPDATPVVGQSVRVRRHGDNASVALLTTDSDGFVTYSVDGSPGEIYFHLQGVPGGDKYWSSYDAMAAGAISLPELPIGLRALGDGVVRGVGSELAVSAFTGQSSLLVEAGVAVVAGHPVVFTTPKTLVIVRPESGTTYWRIVVRVFPATGKAEIVTISGGTDDYPSLTQTDEEYQVSLARVAIPAALPVTVTDERQYVGDTALVSDTARAASASTSSGSGEALAGLSVSLTLPENRPYTVSAELSAVQNVATGWANLGTFGSFGSGIAPNFNLPTQVAVDSSGFVYVGDYNNSRLVKLTSTGAYVSSLSGLTGIQGVAVDGDGNIYVARDGVNNCVRKYDANFTFLADSTFHANFHQCWVQGDYLYVAAPSQVYRFPRSTLSGVTGRLIWGSSGTGNGQFTNAWGITSDGTYVYVTDSHRVQKFTMDGVYVAQWGSLGSGNSNFNTPRGAGIDAGGNVWVSDYSNNVIKQFTNAGTWLRSLIAPTPYGIAFGAGDVLWVSNATDHTLAKWDEIPGGYGQLAIEIDGNVGAYTGIGQRSGSVTNMDAATVQGPDTVTVRAFGKATTDTATFGTLVLSARAEVQR